MAALFRSAGSPHVEAEPGHGKGWYEVQDEGSQLAALLSGASPRQQIIDLCAGSGGKTLALAALMENTGQLYAYDADRLRLRPIFERLGDQATPEQILDLKVCDPAMGSGAFLVEACRLLADRLVKAWETHRATPKNIPPDEDVVTFARRLVAERRIRVVGVGRDVRRRESAVGELGQAGAAGTGVRGRRGVVG